MLIERGHETGELFNPQRVLVYRQKTGQLLTNRKQRCKDHIHAMVSTLFLICDASLGPSGGSEAENNSIGNIYIHTLRLADIFLWKPSLFWRLLNKVYENGTEFSWCTKASKKTTLNAEEAQQIYILTHGFKMPSHISYTYLIRANRVIVEFWTLETLDDSLETVLIAPSNHIFYHCKRVCRNTIFDKENQRDEWLWIRHIHL